MTEQININKVITEGLKQETGCEVVKSNLANAPIPSYPYIAFSIIRAETKKGTYSVDGKRYMPCNQTWSITVQGVDDDGTFEKAMAARDWLEEVGRTTLNDNGIIVQSVGAIQNRDTLLTVEYEYRKGFDVTFSLVNRLPGVDTETIDEFFIEKE